MPTPGEHASTTVNSLLFLSAECDEQDSVAIFALLFSNNKDSLALHALKKADAIAGHIATLSVRKLVAAIANNARLFNTIETEQKRLALQGIEIMQEAEPVK